MFTRVMATLVVAGLLFVALGAVNAQPEKQAGPAPSKVHALGADDMASYAGGDPEDGFTAVAWGDGVVIVAKWHAKDTVCMRGTIEPEKVKALFEATAELRKHADEGYLSIHSPISLFTFRVDGKTARMSWDEIIAPGYHADFSEQYFGFVGEWCKTKARLASVCWAGQQVEFDTDTELQRRTGRKTFKELRGDPWSK